MVIKSYYSQINSMGTERENIFTGNIRFMKENVRHR